MITVLQLLRYQQHFWRNLKTVENVDLSTKEYTSFPLFFIDECYKLIIFALKTKIVDKLFISL